MRAAVEAVRPVVQPTGKVPALSVEVHVTPAIEAASMNPSSWGPSLWPGLPVINVVGIVAARAAAEVARPVMQLTRKVLLVRVFLGVAREVAHEDSLARSLSLTRNEALVRNESLVWLQGGSREEAAMTAVRGVGIILSLSPMKNKHTF